MKHDLQVCLDVDPGAAGGLHGLHLHHPGLACLPLLWQPRQVHGQLSGSNCSLYSPGALTAQYFIGGYLSSGSPHPLIGPQFAPILTPSPQ